MFHEFTQKEQQNQAQLEQFKRKQDEMVQDLKRRDENADYLLSVHDEALKKQRQRQKVVDKKQAAAAKMNQL